MNPHDQCQWCGHQRASHSQRPESTAVDYDRGSFLSVPRYVVNACIEKIMHVSNKRIEGTFHTRVEQVERTVSCPCAKFEESV